MVARRKMPESGKKVKMTLTVTLEVKEMLFAISDAEHKSVSALLAEYAQRKYAKMLKDKKCAPINIPGQMSLNDVKGEDI